MQKGLGDIVGGLGNVLLLGWAMSGGGNVEGGGNVVGACNILEPMLQSDVAGLNAGLFLVNISRLSSKKYKGLKVDLHGSSTFLLWVHTSDKMDLFDTCQWTRLRSGWSAR